MGTLLRFLDFLTNRETDPAPLPLKRFLSSPSLLLLALRNLENQRRRHPIRQTDVVQETCVLLSSFLEFVNKRRDVVGDIPPDAELMRCFLRPSHVSPRTVVGVLRRYAFAEEDDLRFLLRAIQELKWKTAKGRSKRFDPLWRWTPEKRNAKETTWIFRLGEMQPSLELCLDEDPFFALGSVHRQQWRTLPVRAYTDAYASWILSMRETPKREERNRKGVSSNAKTCACMDGVVGPNGQFTDDVEEAHRRSVLQQRLYALHFFQIVRRVRRWYNQKIKRLKSPDKIPIVDKPSPTLTRPDHRVSLEIRRMVPTIRLQRFRGLQYRDQYAQTKGFAIYWYDSHYADILATLAAIESRLTKRGISLCASELGKPDAQELRDSTGERL